MKNTVNKLILDRSCEKLHEKFSCTPDPVFISSGIYLTVFPRTCLQVFAWVRAQGLAGDSKPREGGGGEGAPSRLAQVDGPVNG